MEGGANEREHTRVGPTRNLEFDGGLDHALNGALVRGEEAEPARATVEGRRGVGTVSDGGDETRRELNVYGHTLLTVLFIWERGG
jgi:hypothetical protein